MNKTLLEKAKDVPIDKKQSRLPVTDEEIDLAIAFLEGEITHRQATQVIFGETKGKSFYFKIGSIIRKGVVQGKIKIEKL
ncbi:MAG TPA: hypothetical protein ENH99_01505 [Candidatus Pacearchaeota archaeon]|nr:hypothetical protein [Candidatus Pacearchaeota archaeon]